MVSRSRRRHAGAHPYLRAGRGKGWVGRPNAMDGAPNAPVLEPNASVAQPAQGVVRNLTPVVLPGRLEARPDGSGDPLGGDSAQFSRKSGQLYGPEPGESGQEVGKPGWFAIPKGSLHIPTSGTHRRGRGTSFFSHRREDRSARKGPCFRRVRPWSIGEPIGDAGLPKG